MFRTDVTTAVGSIPTPASPGTQGYFTNGNPATGSAATVVDADFLNRIQEELMTFLTAAAYTPDKQNYGQAANAVQSGSLTYGDDTSGSANVIVVTLSPIPPAYKKGMMVLVKIANQNTGSTVINVNGRGNVAVHANGSALTVGILKAGAMALMAYDGTVFNLLSIYTGTPTGTVFTGSAPSGGTANAQTVTTTTGTFTLTAGNIVDFVAGHTNTAATTLNVDGQGVVTIKKQGSSGLVDLASGDITTSQTYIVVYDGVYFELQSAFNPAAYLQTANALSELTSVAATARANIAAMASTPLFTSAETTPPSSSSYVSIAHGLGVVPKLYKVVMRCKIADTPANYNVGDEIELDGLNYLGSYGASTDLHYLTISADATNVYISDYRGADYGKDKTGASQQAINLSNWKMVVYAWV